MGGADFKATLAVYLQFLPEKIHRLMRLAMSQRAMAHSVIQVLLVHQTMQVIPELYCKPRIRLWHGRCEIILRTVDR